MSKKTETKNADYIPDTQEIAEMSAEVVTPVLPAVQSEAPKFKLLKRVTVELFKWQAGIVYYYKITGAIFQGKPINDKSSAKKKEPAFLMDVIDLSSGAVGQVIVAAVLKSTLLEEYPDNAYVGKSFAIKQRKIPGKDYNGFDIAEIEVE